MEATDDSLKSLFQADEAYANGNVAKAVAYLQAQVGPRMSAIVTKVGAVCDIRPQIPVKGIQADLENVKVMMLKEIPYAKVHAEVMRVDKKYALPGYRAFCGCNKK